MEQFEMQKIYQEIESLKARVSTLESLFNGCAPKQAGRGYKLSLEQRSEIIQKHNHGMSYSALAKEYAVTKSTIGNICHGKSTSPTETENITFTPIRRANRAK